VRGGNPNNFTPVQAFPYNGTLAQVWNFAGLFINGIGTTGLGGKCLDVSGAGTDEITNNLWPTAGTKYKSKRRATKKPRRSNQRGTKAV
jgi:hypothetical protein